LILNSEDDGKSAIEVAIWKGLERQMRLFPHEAPGYNLYCHEALRFKQVGTKVTAMTVQTFKDLLSQRPFRPFRLVMSSGQTYDVRHPEMALLTRSDLLVGTGDADDGVPAEFKICSLLHVATIEPLNPTPA
jgi:hypothetical protein